MRNVETDLHGSFIACGVGILYKYTAPTNTLEIFLRENRTYLFRMPIGERGAENIQALIHNFDKSVQIRALMISNHKTNDITKTLGAEKLQTIIRSAFKIGFYAFDAQIGEWDKLNLAIAQDFNLRKFKIKRLVCPSAGTAYIRCGIETPRNNELTVRAKTPSGVIKVLSERIIQDLIALEFAYRTDSFAHQLVTLSSKLGTLSRLLDKNYIPAQNVSKSLSDSQIAQA